MDSNLKCSIFALSLQAGMIHTDKDEYFIEPLQKGKQEEEEGRTHVVYRRTAVKETFHREHPDTQPRGKVTVILKNDAQTLSTKSMCSIPP